MDSLTLLYDCKTKVLQRFFIAKNNKRKHRFLHVPPNKVIKDTYLEIKNELIKLRFKTVGFKAFDGDDKTYWELSSKSDLEI